MRILDDVIVHAEWQHGGNRLHVQTLLFGKDPKLRDVVDVLSYVDFEPYPGRLVFEDLKIRWKLPPFTPPVIRLRPAHLGCPAQIKLDPRALFIVPCCSPQS